MLKKIFLSVLLILFYSSMIFPQSTEEIKSQLKSQGITNAEEIKAALKERNMTEDDAREMAKQYGISYDQFIASYIQGGDVQQKSPQDTVKLKPFIPQLPKSTESISVKKDVKPTATVKEKKIKYFGYDLFKNIPESFKPTEVGPIDPGYIIGPGDVLQLYLWGAVEFQYQLTVDIQGNIFIPTAGQVFVSGIAYKDLEKKLSKYLSKFYEGLNANPPTVFLDITLAKLRPIRIFVLGEIAQPGGYSISSYATVFNALYSVGGPLTSGSLREIRIIRNNKVISKVDLYDYLLKGNLIGDVRLQNNDIVFVPPRGKTVTIKGEIHRPAIYELKQNENLKTLITYAGDLKSTAYTGRASILRIVPFEERKNYKLDRKVIDVDLSKLLEKTSDYELFDQDVVTIFPILDKMENFVKISGAVYRPGTFQLDKVPDVKSLVEEAYGTLPDVFLGKADIIRTRQDSTREFITFDLGKALDGDPLNNVQLKPMDEVRIYSIYDLRDRHYVSIDGYVNKPLRIEYADSLTLYDIVFQAGKWEDPLFKGRAYLQRGDVIRFNPDGISTKIISFDLDKLLSDKIGNIHLEPGDKIYIYKADVNKVIDKYVKIEGEVKNPGIYKLSTNMTVMDLIIQAGGFLESSLTTEAYVNRLDPNGYEGNTLSETHIVKLPFEFNSDLMKFIKDSVKADDSEFYFLQHRDVVIIRKNPNWEPQRIVQIKGEVEKPGTYVLKKKNETLLEVLKEAGGPTEEAYLLGASLVRRSFTDSNKVLNERVIINLDEIYNENNTEEDIYLKDGDVLFIPKHPHTVYVKGEVNNPGLYKFVEGYSVKDYINKAGGETDSSDFILYQMPTGESNKVGLGIFSCDPDVLDGSIINVIKKIPEPPTDKSEIFATIKDIFSITVSAITAIVLAARL